MRLASAVVVNYNGKECIGRCLNSLRNQTYPLEIILVDNGSRDGSREYVISKFPDVNVIPSSNVGFAEGCNIGIREARGDFIVLLNPDAVAHPDWVANLVKVASLDESIGIVGSKIFYKDNTIMFAGGKFSYIIPGMAFLKGRGKPDSPEYDYTAPTPFIDTCGALVKRSVFERIGLFDRTYFCGVDDLDLCWRARKEGFKVMYNHKAIVHHEGGYVLGQQGKSPKHAYYQTMGSLYFIKKNLPRRIKFITGAAYFVFLFYFLVKVRFKRIFIKAVWQGIKDGLR